jgi:glutathione S-transferase
MAAPKLTYFDFDGGRGEVARLAFAIGGVPFVDDRVPFAAWNDRKPHTPFGGLPVLEVDGRSVAQSNGINRFVGKLVGLYPADPWQAACCDEAMDAVEEIGGKIVATFELSAAEKKAQRDALASGPIPFFLTRLQDRLKAHGGRYFADDRLTVADLKVFMWIRHLKSGSLDHIPSDLPDRVAPGLVEHCERVRSLAEVRAYYAMRQTAG